MVYNKIKVNHDGTIDIDLPDGYNADDIFDAISKVGKQIEKEYAQGLWVPQTSGQLKKPKTIFELIEDYFHAK